MKRKRLVLAFLLIALCINAQDIEVKKFGPLDKDKTAVTSHRKDINGTACGLVMLALKERGGFEIYEMNKARQGDFYIK